MFKLPHRHNTRVIKSDVKLTHSEFSIVIQGVAR